MKSRMSPLVTSAACNLQKKTKMCDMVRKNPIGRKSHSGPLFSETSGVEQETRSVCGVRTSTPRESVNNLLQNGAPPMRKAKKLSKMRDGSGTL